MEKIVLYGGTFDPVHNAHLRNARHASLVLNADVVFVIAKNPRWKTPIASAIDRHNMLKIALKKEGTGSVYISDYELKSNAEINYTIDTVRYFKNKYKNREIFLLIGADQVAQFHEWQEADEIAKLAKIVYVNRTDITINSDNIKRFNMSSLTYDKAGEVSSSAIRELHSLDLPREVLDYIEDHELYFIKRLKEFYYTPKRFDHALSVANIAYQIARSNKREEAGACYIAGLLHDIAKKVSEKKMKEIMQKEYPQYYKDMPPSLYHQFVGAYLAKTDFNINDERVLDAIMFHASGKAHMSPICKIVYSADKVDPLRGYNSKKLIKGCLNNYYTGFQMVLKANKEYLLEHHFDISNPLTKECMELYLPHEK